MRFQVLPGPNGTVRTTGMALDIVKHMTFCLFKLIPHPGLAFGFVGEFVKEVVRAQRETGIDDIGLIVLQVDAIENCIKVCPPIVDVDTKKVTFLPKDYEEAIRDSQWPSLWLDVDPVGALRPLAPYGPKDRVGPKEVKTNIVPVGETGKIDKR